VCDFEVVDLFEEIESVADGCHFEVLEGVVVKVHKHIAGNFVFYV
jgi:hypothetical protein